MADDVRNQSPIRDEHNCHATRAGRVWWIFAAIALFYLLSEHRAHLFGALPFLLLLACPLMHFFMHGRHHGHGNHSDHGDHGDKETRP